MFMFLLYPFVLGPSKNGFCLRNCSGEDETKDVTVDGTVFCLAETSVVDFGGIDENGTGLPFGCS